MFSEGRHAVTSICSVAPVADYVRLSPFDSRGGGSEWIKTIFLLEALPPPRREIKLANFFIGGMDGDIKMKESELLYKRRLGEDHGIKVDTYL